MGNGQNLVTICSFFYPKREDVVKALYPILLHPEMICCPKIQPSDPSATNCAQLFTASCLLLSRGSHTVPGCAVHRQSLHNVTCQTVSHTYIFKSKCILLNWTYFLLGKAAGLKRQNSSKSLKIKAVLQNQSIHSNFCKPDLLCQVLTLLSGSNSDKSCHASLAFFITVKITISKNYMYFAKENKGKIYLPTQQHLWLSHLL